jgi:hypothetical protein
MSLRCATVKAHEFTYNDLSMAAKHSYGITNGYNFELLWDCR